MGESPAFAPAADRSDWNSERSPAAQAANSFCWRWVAACVEEGGVMGLGTSSEEDMTAVDEWLKREGEFFHNEGGNRILDVLYRHKNGL